jgi:hypothetical protein
MTGVLSSKAVNSMSNKGYYKQATTIELEDTTRRRRRLEDHRLYGGIINLQL